MEQPVRFAIRDLNFYYDDGTQALKDVSLDIYANEILVLFGPARSGKSTLLRLLNRLTDLLYNVERTGQVLLDGQDIYAPGINVVQLRRQVGMVFALPIPLPMTIWENVAYGPKLSGVHSPARLDELMERSLEAAALWDEVKDRLHEPASALSGGQQQRLCIARVLALEPEVILLDNPTSGLDPISTAKVEASLRELKKNYTVVLVPHSIQQAARMADRAAFILSGEIIECDRAGELFTRPKEKQTEDYITGRFG